MDELSSRKLTVREAAEVLAVSEFSVRRLVNTGALPHFRTSRGKKAHVRICESDLLAFMKGERGEARAVA
jgi:excisionase family DNA binding protein